VVVAFVVLAGGLAVRYLFVTTADDAAVHNAPRISDTSFERAATAVCKRYVSVFDTATTLGKEPSQVEAGDFLEQIARQFDQMSTQLKAIPVSAADQTAVNQWLADWEAYDAYGHQYAAAVRSGNERDLVVRDTGRIGSLRRRRNGFAKANHLSACAFN